MICQGKNEIAARGNNTRLQTFEEVTEFKYPQGSLISSKIRNRRMTGKRDFFFKFVGTEIKTNIQKNGN